MDDPGPDPILGAVAAMLETDGYDAVQLREVARRAKTSLATIYKRYPTRDELILAALEAWLEKHRYAGITPHPRAPGESLYEAQMHLLRTIFEPWEKYPGMLRAFFRARSAPGGQRLLRRGMDAVVPAGMELLAGVDADFIADLDAVLLSLVHGLIGRYAAGEIAITDILPTLDRAVYWMTKGYSTKGDDTAP